MKTAVAFATVLFYTMRETTISVSNEEKAALNEAKLEMYGTKEIPYGVVIAELIDRATTDE